jgi:hypothetical protein
MSEDVAAEIQAVLARSGVKPKEIQAYLGSVQQSLTSDASPLELQLTEQQRSALVDIFTVFSRSLNQIAPQTEEAAPAEEEPAAEEEEEPAAAEEVPVAEEEPPAEEVPGNDKGLIVVRMKKKEFLLVKRLTQEVKLYQETVSGSKEAVVSTEAVAPEEKGVPSEEPPAVTALVEEEEEEEAPEEPIKELPIEVSSSGVSLSALDSTERAALSESDGLVIIKTNRA